MGHIRQYLQDKLSEMEKDLYYVGMAIVQWDKQNNILKRIEPSKVVIYSDNGKFAEMNMNNYVKFKLEDHGKEIWLNHYKENGIDFTIPECDEEGFHELQMWQYCQIFGEHMGNGFNNPTNLNVKVQLT